MASAVGHRRKLAALTCVLGLALALVAATSQAEFVQSGKLLVSFDAGIQPSKLPRSELVPVKVGFRGTFENLDASDTPALQSMQVRLSRGGEINSKGLPVCPKAKLDGLNTAQALRVCRDALVGDGVIRSAFRFPDGRRARSQAKMLLFNAARGLLMHVYTTSPLTGTFLVPMSIHRGSGAFGTVLRANFPRIAAGYGFLTGFEMVIQRSFNYRGQKQSYVVASCPAPSGFNRVDFELARVTYRFRGGITVRNAAIRTCKVRGR
jgi:hypothetical protein